MTERVQGPAFYFPSIEKKYGRPIGYWFDLISSSELTRHKALVDWLKAGYGLGHGHATALAGHALAQRDAANPRAEPQQSQGRDPARRSTVKASDNHPHGKPNDPPSTDRTATGR